MNHRSDLKQHPPTTRPPLQYMWRWATSPLLEAAVCLFLGEAEETPIPLVPWPCPARSINCEPAWRVPPRTASNPSAMARSDISRYIRSRGSPGLSNCDIVFGIRDDVRCTTLPVVAEAVWMQMAMEGSALTSWRTGSQWMISPCSVAEKNAFF